MLSTHFLVHVRTYTMTGHAEHCNRVREHITVSSSEQLMMLQKHKIWQASSIAPRQLITRHKVNSIEAFKTIYRARNRRLLLFFWSDCDQTHATDAVQTGVVRLTVATSVVADGGYETYELSVFWAFTFIVDYNIFVLYAWRNAAKHTHGLLCNPIVFSGLLKLIWGKRCFTSFRRESTPQILIPMSWRASKRVVLHEFVRLVLKTASN